MIAEPYRIARLPRDPARGVPVPWFVAWIDGRPDFRVVAPGKIEQAVQDELCWVCGTRRGRYATFLIGPMCAVNRVSAEPPSHRECAVYSALTCPFLLNPDRRRRTSQMPEDVVDPAGEMIRRNPGVSLVWTTKAFHLRFDSAGGLLFDIGEPHEVRWYREGRDATRAEVEASIESGLPILRDMAEQDERPELSLAALDRMTAAARTLLPGGAS